MKSWIAEVGTKARRSGRALTAAALALLALANVANAQLKPNASWREFKTRHFNVVYEAGLDSLARHAADRAETEHARLSAGLIRAPRGKIDLIIANNVDISNGTATPLPDNRIVIWVRPPADDLGLQYYDDWIDLVVVHELTHIFHLDQAGRFGHALRSVFGRIPFAWPVFPLLGMPRWTTEGLAVFVESEHTGFGRVHGSYHEMVVRTDVLENSFPTIGRVSGETPVWPGGQRAYIYGSLFMDYISRQYGDSAHTELIRKSAGSFLPAPWRMDGIAKKALGTSYSDVYKEWHDDLSKRYAALADSLRSDGLTQSETITTSGRLALYPRLSHDGRYLAYADESGIDAIATRVIDLSNGTAVRTRRNGLGPVAWLPGSNGYITAQFQFAGRYEIFSELYSVKEGRETRLTRGGRAETPDATADGTRLVYVQNASGTNRLMLRDLANGRDSVFIEGSPDVQWVLPRWSPDGDYIAVQKWTRERGHDVAIVNVQTLEEKPVRTSGVDGAPAWSPDGRYIVFSSDRTGISNLYAFDREREEIRQITNVLGGAFYPEVSPDGKSIYYSGYHADGFHIERMPFDPVAWRAPAPVANLVAIRSDTAAATVGVEKSAVSASAYSPLRSMLPKFWLPAVWGDTALSVFAGFTTGGNDDVGRHTYALDLGYDAKHGRTAGSIRYDYAGLGNPVLSFEAAREWDFTGNVRVRADSLDAGQIFGSFEREDRIALTASMVRRDWRANQAFTFGIEGVAFNRGVLGPASFRDPQDKLIGVLGGFSFANYRFPALAISPEDGIRANAFVRRRFEIDPGVRDASYTELLGSASAYKSAGSNRFAHNVLALRVSALHRTDIGRGPTDVGGITDFLSVRGFDKRERVGFTGWSSSLEYRMPLALIGRGYKLRPLFVDRIAGTFFADAGNASCSSEQRAVYLSCAGADDNSTETLVSAGFELSANVAFLFFYPGWMRAGVAFPLKGGERNAKLYLTISPTF